MSPKTVNISKSYNKPTGSYQLVNVSLVARALDWYCRGHEFKSCTGLNFFRLYFHYGASMQCLHITAKISFIFNVPKIVFPTFFHSFFCINNQRTYLWCKCILVHLKMPEVPDKIRKYQLPTHS